MPAITGLTSAVNSPAERRRWSPRTWGIEASPAQPVSAAGGARPARAARAGPPRPAPHQLSPLCPREGRTARPPIYGHWCNSFNVIYLTAEEMANAWRVIGHAGFVHF